MKSKTTSPKKKAYRPPRLRVYGDLRRLTMGKGGQNNDGTGKPKTKTSGSFA
jgi:hypothetical protein